MRKQLSGVVLQIRGSEKYRKINREISVLESLFNNIAGLEVCNFIKKWLQYSWFSPRFSKFFRTPNLQKTSRLLLLNLQPFVLRTGKYWNKLDYWYFVSWANLSRPKMTKRKAVVVVQEWPSSITYWNCRCYSKNKT